MTWVLGRPRFLFQDILTKISQTFKINGRPYSRNHDILTFLKSVKITNPEKFDLILKMFDNILVVSWHKL